MLGVEHVYAYVVGRLAIRCLVLTEAFHIVLSVVEAFAQAVAVGVSCLLIGFTDTALRWVGCTAHWYPETLGRMGILTPFLGRNLRLWAPRCLQRYIWLSDWFGALIPWPGPWGTGVEGGVETGEGSGDGCWH
jgi:protein-S-isoprenylcysteine O-methyltransferase Ste14